MICLGSPLTESPTKYFNKGLENVLESLQDVDERNTKNSETTYFFMHGGEKDLHIPSTKDLDVE